MSTTNSGDRARVRAQLSARAAEMWRADVFAHAARAEYQVGLLGGEVLPAALLLAWLDDGSGSWDEEAEAAGIEWDYAARRPGEEYPIDYEAALYWPEAVPAHLADSFALGCRGRRRGGEHE